MTTCICRTCNCSDEEINEYHRATSPLQVALDEFVANEKKGEYELTSIVGRVFYHEKEDALTLFDRALAWVEREGVGVLEMRYDNSSSPYSESVTVIAERA